MNERFGDSARLLAGFASRALGWRPGDFWEATPAELATILAPEAEPSSAPLSRAELNGLMERERNG